MPEEITTPTTAPTTSWFDPFEPEIKGHLQNKGWDKLDPAAAVAEAVKAHRAAEKHLGAPADEIVRLPKDPNDAGWAAVHKRLGKPDAPEGYDLSPLSPAEKPLAAELVAAVQAAAHKANMTPGQALELTSAILKHQGEVATKAATEVSFNAAAAAEALKANWGPNYETNMFVARRAAEVLGITPETVAAWEKGEGGPKVLEEIRKLGVQMGEARVIQGQGPGQAGPMSADQAAEWLASLKTDKALYDKWYERDSDTVRKFEQATRAVVQARQAR